MTEHRNQPVHTWSGWAALIDGNGAEASERIPGVLSSVAGPGTLVISFRPESGARISRFPEPAPTVAGWGLFNSAGVLFYRADFPLRGQGDTVMIDWDAR
jgi:hypothetical protein